MIPKEGDNSRYRHLSNYNALMDSLPKPGSKLRLREAKWAFHTNVLENGRRLVPGQIYTVEGVEMASSWTAVTLEETGSDVEYCLSFFDRVTEGEKGD